MNAVCPNVPSRHWVMTSGNLGPFRVRSLAETAQIMNLSGLYPRRLQAKDVLRIERQALSKIRKRAPQLAAFL